MKMTARIRVNSHVEPGRERVRSRAGRESGLRRGAVRATCTDVTDVARLATPAPPWMLTPQISAERTLAPQGPSRPGSHTPAHIRAGSWSLCSRLGYVKRPSQLLRGEARGLSAREVSCREGLSGAWSPDVHPFSPWVPRGWPLSVISTKYVCTCVQGREL